MAAMKLYLVQHGLSKSEEEDPDRSLTDQGRKDADKVGAYISNHTGIQVENIYHSGKTRARQTAVILNEYLKPRGGVEEAIDLLPMDDPEIWAGMLNNRSDSAILVSHLPYLSRLASLLICGDPENKVVDFKNAGVVSLNRDNEGVWSVDWIITPAIIK